MSKQHLIRLFDWWRSLAGGWPALLLNISLLAAALACFFLTGAIVIRGSPWAHFIYAENPYAHFVGGIFLIIALHYISYGYRDSAAAWKHRAGKLFLLLFSLGFSFLAGELALRLILISRQQGNSVEDLHKLTTRPTEEIRTSHPLGVIIHPSPWPAVVYELRPDIDMFFGARTLRTNHSGFRESREYTVERQPNSVRIVGIGDSGMFGWDLDQDQNYLDVLEQELNKAGGGKIVEAINMAVPGYNTQLEAETLRHKGLAYQPDIVIVGWCENDGQLPFFLLEKEDFTRRDVSFLDMYLCRRDDFLQVASGTTIKDLRSYDAKKVSPDILSGIEEQGLRKAFGEIKAMRDEHGFKLLVFGPIGEGVRNLLGELGIDFYNTREHINDKDYPEEWAVYFMHPSKEGHRVLGEHLARHLVERGFVAVQYH